MNTPMLDSWPNVNRAAMIVSANAILAAGTTFMLGQATKFGNLNIDVTIFVVSLIITLVLIVLSMIYAANTIVFVWKRTRDAIDIDDLPKLKFFHASDIVKSFPKFSDYKSAIGNLSKKEFIDNALGELIQVTSTHYKRYKF